jgi:transposase-like protein
MHTPAEQVSSALYDYYSGKSIDAIRKGMTPQPSTATVFEWVNKYTDEAIQATRDYHPNVGDTWIADETYVRVDMRKRGEPAVVNPYIRSKKAKWIMFWDIIDADTRYLLASHITTTRGTKDAQALMEKAAKRAGKVPKVVVTDRLAAYLDGVELAFGADTKHRQGAPFEIENNTNLIERFHGTLKARTKVMRALRNKVSAEKFTDGWLVHYNYLREHGSLGETPAEAAKLDYSFKNWADVCRAVKPQAQILRTPAKVSILKTPRATVRITPEKPRLSTRRRGGFPLTPRTPRITDLGGGIVQERGRRHLRLY